MDRTCQSCRHNNDISANFCSSCGERIAGGPDAETESISVIEAIEASEDVDHLADREGFASDTGLLVVDEGPKSGSRYALDAEVITAGRHPESDIFLDDVTVSRRHVEISHTGSSYRAKDVGSLNGTYINKQLIEDEALVDGDELQIGRFKLIFFHGTGQTAGTA